MRRKILFGVDYTDSELIKLWQQPYPFAWQHCIIISWAMFWFLTAAAVTNAARSLAWCFW